MKVIRGDDSHSSSLMFKIVSVNIQWHDDLLEFLQTGDIIQQPTAYFLTVTKIQESISKTMGNQLFADLHNEPNFGLQKKVLFKESFVYKRKPHSWLLMLLSFINSLFVCCKLSN